MTVPDQKPELPMNLAIACAAMTILMLNPRILSEDSLRMADEMTSILDNYTPSTADTNQMIAAIYEQFKQ